MSRKEENELKYMIALVSDFAAAYGMQQKQAFNYLHRFKALDFFREHYDVMHTQSFEDTIADLVIVCRRNGGQIS